MYATIRSAVVVTTCLTARRMIVVSEYEKKVRLNQSCDA